MGLKIPLLEVNDTMLARPYQRSAKIVYPQRNKLGNLKTKEPALEVKISDSTRLYYSNSGFKPLKGMSEEEIIKISEYVSSSCVRPGDLEEDILKRIETEAVSVLDCDVHPPDLNGMRKAAGLKVEEFKATYMDIEGKRRLMVEVKVEYKKNGNGVYDTIIKLPDENLIRGLVKNA